MKTREDTIFPVFEKILQRSDKEAMIKQHAKVIWLTGLSGSGKTTIAIGLEKELNKKGYLTQILDGDNIRKGVNSNLGFSEEDRVENIRRIAEISKLFINCGIITINCFISPTEEMRNLAKKIIGRDDFIEVFVNASLETCEKRDVKGLYKKAKEGKIEDFTGIDAPFEHPSSPNIEINTNLLTIEESVQKVLEYVLPDQTLVLQQFLLRLQVLAHMQF